MKLLVWRLGLDAMPDLPVSGIAEITSGLAGVQKIDAEEQLTVKRVLELAESAPALYRTQNPER